jgi:hypothetical protein
MSKRVVALTPSDFQLIVDKRGGLIPLSDFTGPAQKQFDDEGVGCLVCYLKEEKHEATGQDGGSVTQTINASMKSSRLAIVVWRGMYCINVMCNKTDVLTMSSHAHTWRYVSM